MDPGAVITRDQHLAHQHWSRLLLASGFHEARYQQRSHNSYDISFNNNSYSANSKPLLWLVISHNAQGATATVDWVIRRVGPGWSQWLFTTSEALLIYDVTSSPVVCVCIINTTTQDNRCPTPQSGLGPLDRDLSAVIWHWQYSLDKTKHYSHHK